MTIHDLATLWAEMKAEGAVAGLSPEARYAIRLDAVANDVSEPEAIRKYAKDCVDAYRLKHRPLPPFNEFLRLGGQMRETGHDPEHDPVPSLLRGL